jgi:hypothetical protein
MAWQQLYSSTKHYPLRKTKISYYKTSFFQLLVAGILEDINENDDTYFTLQTMFKLAYVKNRESFKQEKSCEDFQGVRR